MNLDHFVTAVLGSSYSKFLYSKNCEKLKKTPRQGEILKHVAMALLREINIILPLTEKLCIVG